MRTEFDMLCLSQGDDDAMARRRLQLKGHLYRDGRWWRLRWREDVIGEDGKITRSRPTAVIAACKGRGSFTRKKAERLAWDAILSKLDQAQMCPQSIMTLGDFVERHFIPEHVQLKKLAGRRHYATILKHVIVALGSKTLRDIGLGDVQRLVAGMVGREYRYAVGKGKNKKIRTGSYSVQTAVHVRNAISAIFRHAKQNRMYAGDNPAELVRLPEMQRRESHALSAEQMTELLEVLESPTRELALFATLTSMNIAELCGLVWRRVNLADTWLTVDGEVLPPMTLAVRQQWYRGAYGTVKARSRRRNLPISQDMAAELAAIRCRSKFIGPDDPVFAASTGRPVDEHNLAKRKLKPAGVKLGMPWLSWHAFRRTHTTLADQLEMTAGDRVAMMGHADFRMTSHYTVVDLDRRRAVIERMGEVLKKPAHRESGELVLVRAKAK